MNSGHPFWGKGRQAKIRAAEKEAQRLGWSKDGLSDFLETHAHVVKSWFDDDRDSLYVRGVPYESVREFKRVRNARRKAGLSMVGHYMVRSQGA